MQTGQPVHTVAEMASQFIGLHMRVILRDPPGFCLTGTVRNVEAGDSLTLENVYTPDTQEHTSQLKIVASNIADLTEVAQGETSLHFVAAAQDTVVPSFSSKQPSQPTLTDPAILSVGRRPPSNATSASASQLPSDKGNRQDLESGPMVTDKLHEGRRPEQDLLDSIKSMRIQTPSREQGYGTPADLRQTPKQKKKTRVRPPKQSTRHIEDHAAQPTHSSPAPTVRSGHGKGWRQTPILESNISFQPFNSLKRNNKSRQGGQDNGWASEDVTEEMGDFDFANNLAKFDKRTIFDQMRQEDQVDDASRLVSHNRRAKPGTWAKSLHFSENVLDLPSATAPGTDFWNSEADVGVNDGDRLSGREARNGHGTSRRADSKSGPSRQSQSRKASGVIGGHPLSRVSSTVGFGPAILGRQAFVIDVRALANGYAQQQAQQPGFYLVPSNRRLEAISTLQMLNLENIAANELGFSESLMAENAGRGIAEVAVMALDDPAIKVRFKLAVGNTTADASPSSSTIVILAGNNKSGIRALAAGRHLRNKNRDVMVCLVGIERERDLLEDVRRQVQLYRNFGGKVLGKNDLFEQLRNESTSGSPVSVSLIIDALLGLTISFEELRIGDQASVYELMEWANRNEAFVLSVDVPTGIDPTTGKIAIIDGGQLYVKPRYVVAIGAPKRGLLEAVTHGGELGLGSGIDAGPEGEWRLFIADMGLGSTVWQKAGTKVRRGIDFDGKWVLEMQYRGAEVESE